MTTQEILEGLRSLARGKSPNAELAEFLNRHGCENWLARLPNSPYKQQFAMQRVMSSIAVKERYKACIPFFSQSDFPYAVIKGAVLSQALYGDPFLRTSGDIDVLIRREDADRVKKLLLANGFVQGRVTDHGIEPFNRREILFQTVMSHQTAPYIKETGNRMCPYVNLDVNMDVLWGECNEKADMNVVLSHTEESSLLGISFQKLPPEMEFLSLCLHHYKDMNSLYLLAGGSLHLGLFCELYDYLRNVRPDAQKLHEACNRLQVGRYLYVCLYDTQRIFESEVIEPYLEVLEASKDDSLPDTFGLNDRERQEWSLGLLERLFHPDLSQFLQEQLTDEEKEKIRINREWM